MRVDWLITGMQVTGGAEMYVRRLAPRLRSSGVDLRVITFLPGGDLLEALRNDGVPVIILGLKHKLDPRPLFRLLALWRKNPPDLVHTHLYHAGVAGRLLARLAGVRHVVVHQHGEERSRSAWRSLLDRTTAPLADHYIATCQVVAAMLRQREGIPAAKIAVIYNGVDIDLYSGQAPSSMPSGWQSGGSPVIGCVGRLSPEKGQSRLLQAFAEASPTFPGSRLVLVGDGRDLDRLTALADRLGIRSRVQFAGEQTDVTAWLRCFDLFVLPSEWEGISLALLEAMAAGLPVVATQSGGTPEVVVDGETGLLVLPHDPQELATAITRLLSDPELKVRYGQAGSERVRQHFSLSQTVAQTLQLYRELLDEGKL